MSKIVQAPCCDRKVISCTINDGKCATCRKDARRRRAPPSPPVTVDEVRRLRGKLLQATDWSEFPDVPADHRGRFRAVRQELRDITDLDPVAAMQRLSEIQKDLSNDR